MKNPWFPLYDGDLLTNTMHLTATELGCYIRLLIHAYNHHGEIPSDDGRLAHISGIDARQWWRVKETVLQFWQRVDEGRLQHGRVVSELLRSHEISNKRKAAALQMHSKRTASADANRVVITTQHKDKKEPHTAVARRNGSGGGGSLSQVEQDRLIAAYERQTGKPWDQTAHLGGTMSPERPASKR